MNQVKEDYTKADIPKKDKVMLYYAVKLTKEPGKMIERDVIALKNIGFSDVDILDINQIVAYYAYVNRVADGLGVNLESFWFK